MSIFVPLLDSPFVVVLSERLCCSLIYAVVTTHPGATGFLFYVRKKNKNTAAEISNK